MQPIKVILADDQAEIELEAPAIVEVMVDNSNR